MQNTSNAVASSGLDSTGNSEPAAPLPQHQQQLQNQQWPTNFESYELVGKIGQGAFASVWRATCTSSNTDPDESQIKRQCGIKILDLEQIDTNLVDIRLEVQTMRLSSHPNILTCFTSFVKQSELWLVTQLMDKGSSLHCMQICKSIKRDHHSASTQPSSDDTERQHIIERHITCILHETLLGLNYIHKNGQIHRDIKACNILLNSDAAVKIADFGVSGWLVQSGSKRENTKTFVGTPCWMAPEVMEQIHGYDYKADIWSLGITALELAKGYAPYAKYAPMKVLLMTIQEPPPSLETYEDYDDIDDNSTSSITFSKSFQDMISLCLQKDPSNRPTCEQLLLHKHFRNYHESNILQKRCEELRNELQSYVNNVGLSDKNRNTNNSCYPGTSPVYLANRPAGTSWIFTDGSQVLTTSLTDKSQDDVDCFFDEFEANTTRGENFNSLTKEQHILEQKRLNEKKIEEMEKRKQEKEDMEMFFDEFEKSTGGENFKKNNI